MTAIVKRLGVSTTISLSPPCTCVAADELENKQTKPPEDRSVIIFDW
jgi:hypothetical protein